MTLEQSQIITNITNPRYLKFCTFQLILIIEVWSHRQVLVHKSFLFLLNSTRENSQWNPCLAQNHDPMSIKRDYLRNGQQDTPVIIFHNAYCDLYHSVKRIQQPMYALFKMLWSSSTVKYPLMWPCTNLSMLLKDVSRASRHVLKYDHCSKYCFL